MLGTWYTASYRNYFDKYCTNPPYASCVQGGPVQDTTGWNHLRPAGNCAGPWGARSGSGVVRLPSIRPTRARSIVMFTHVAPNGHAISSTRSPRSTYWRKVPRTGTRWALCHQSPSLWRGQVERLKMTVSLIAEKVCLRWWFVLRWTIGMYVGVVISIVTGMRCCWMRRLSKKLLK